MNDYAIIMAGGIGTRFWPKGRAKLPKQFLKIGSDSDTMIQKTVKRLDGMIHHTKIFIVTNINYKALVKKQLPHIPEENIICEPFGKNTAPCIALACLYIKQFNPEAGVFVIPSDHIVNNVKDYQNVVKSGLSFVKENGGIVTLGISPTKPETGYGYIQFDSDISTEVSPAGNSDYSDTVYKVKTFAEKPTLEVAKAFLESGDFLWNSGMFIFRIDTMMEEFKNNLPEINAEMIALEEKLYDKEFPKLLEEAYSQIKGISIDYGIMEKSSQVYTIRSYFDWSDVGSWDEIYNMKQKDENGNLSQGMSVLINSKNCMVLNDQRITAVVGCEDLLIIDTDNGLLVCKRGDSQNVKEVVDYLRRKGLDQYL